MSVRPPLRLSFVACVALAAASLLVGCPGGPGADGPKRALPPYTGHATELFDDAIEPQAVGLEIESGRPPMGDPVLRERTQVADAVVRVRITTVTGKQEESGATYQIGFHIVDQIAGPHPPPQDFQIKLAPHAPAVGILRNLEDRLVGMKLTYIAFVRGFTRADDPDGELHFHVCPDTKDYLKAVMEAATLAELK
jgi:hypothetical protein